MKTIEDVPTKMKALVLHKVGDLRYEDVPIKNISKDEVMVKIKAAGICSSDRDRIFKNGTYHFPTIPGHEFSGQIVMVNDEDTNLLGKKVAVFPLIPCKECSACQKEEYAQCSNYNYFGSRCDGAFSEYLVVPKWNLVYLEDNMPYEKAALCEPAAVSIHAMNVGNVKNNDNVLIIGTGTIGFLIALFCKNKGANVMMATRRDESYEFAKSLGIIPIKNDENLKDNISKITDNLDVIFEAVGTNASISTAIDCGTNFTNIVLVGNPSDDLNVPKNIYWKILRKQMTLKGTWNSKYTNDVNDWKDAIKIMNESEFDFSRLITKTFKLEEKDEAFKFFLRDEFKLKVMFKM